MKAGPLFLAVAVTALTSASGDTRLLEKNRDANLFGSPSVDGRFEDYDVAGLVEADNRTPLSELNSEGQSDATETDDGNPYFF